MHVLLHSHLEPFFCDENLYDLPFIFSSILVGNTVLLSIVSMLNITSCDLPVL